jgi:AbrB family looped-hinge helix DNA binding protein
MHNSKELFYGSTTMGEKGQVVIPAKAREAMNITKGEKLLVFSMGKNMVALMKLSNLEKIASHMEKGLEMMRKAAKGLK